MKIAQKFKQLECLLEEIRRDTDISISEKKLMNSLFDTYWDYRHNYKKITLKKD